MPAQSQSPYLAHIFVCTNDRKGERKSCADNQSPLVRARLKEVADAKGWQGKVRISNSGCMGLCTNGPNVLIYPQKIWFSEVSPEDVDIIVAAVERILSEN